MSSGKLKGLASLLILGATLLLFQNCGKIEMKDQSSLDLGKLSDPVAHNVPHVLLSTGKTSVATDMEFSANEDAGLLAGASFSWSHKLDGIENGCVAKSSGIAKQYVLSCDKAGTLVVSVFASESGKSLTVQEFSAPIAAPMVSPTPTPAINMLVNFNIPAGTAKNPWNTAATMVETFVGQTLRITNLDSVAHQLHTGGRPFAHGQAIATGTNREMKVVQSYSATANGNIYDHGAGTTARFYLVAYDGAALYATNCASCHGALATSTKAKVDVARIKNSLTSVSAMSAIPAVANLTQRQIEAIAYALGTR